MDVTIQRDGVFLRGKLESPSKSPCPIVVMFHGFTGNLGASRDSLFTLIANELLQRNIAVLRFDFNGHGKSDGALVDMDVLNEIEDAIAMLEYARSLKFVSDIYILGHSQGGVVGGMLAGLYADVISKLVLLAPAATLKDDALRGTCMGTLYDTDHIPKVVRINNGTTEVGGKYFRIAKYLPIYEITKAFQGPTLVIHGEDDLVVDRKAAYQYKQGMKDCQLEVFSDLGHGIEGKEQGKAITKVVEFLQKGIQDEKR
ncbi:MAG: alpha/beta fold hydrolase [bacterium]|nr:alpha/beta fold hydrolase [bacterium]